MSKKISQPAKPATPAGLVMAAGIVVILALAAVVRAVAPYVPLLVGGLVVIVGGRVAWSVARFGLASRAAKRNYPAAWWALFRWRWLTRNLDLAYLDQHRRRARPVPRPFGTAAKVRAPEGGQPATLRYPRARIRADEYGIVAKVKTVPGTGRAEFEKAAPHIANYWRCVRVQVGQPKPGRLVVRGLRRDPLAEPFAYSEPLPKPPGPWHLYLGRDEWGQERHIRLPGLTGITVGGLPGFGKTSLIMSILCQLLGLATVQPSFADGKGGGDYAPFADRAIAYAGDELADAAEVIDGSHEEMRRRLALVSDGVGPRNRWAVGPTVDWPLWLTIIDECHTYMDLEAVKGDREAERLVRQVRHHSAQLVKRGRSVLMLTVFITQKQTSDAIPTAIRDNCGLGLSFAVKTIDAAIASLGESIRRFPSACPTGLQDPSMIGVCTAALRTGQDPFVRLRVPEVTEAAADARASAYAHLRRVPAAPVSSVVPAPSLLPPLAADQPAA